MSNSREQAKHIGEPGREYTQREHIFVVLQYEHFHFPTCSFHRSSAPQFSHVHVSTSAPIICLKIITFETVALRVITLRLVRLRDVALRTTFFFKSVRKMNSINLSDPLIFDDVITNVRDDKY